MKDIILNNGSAIPCIGFGTCTHGKNVDFEKIICGAIDVGYRYFDTASMYKTESLLGNAIKKSGVDRKDLIIASKAWYDETGKDKIREALYKSLDRLGLDYLDVYLIHWPKRSTDDEGWKENVVETWKTMEELHKQGLIKSLGLSNFLPHHTEVNE